jgi:hypothetical protein
MARHLECRCVGTALVMFRSSQTSVGFMCGGEGAHVNHTPNEVRAAVSLREFGGYVVLNITPTNTTYSKFLLLLFVTVTTAMIMTTAVRV